jgi:hypothetical protein
MTRNGEWAVMVHRADFGKEKRVNVIVPPFILGDKTITTKDDERFLFQNNINTLTEGLLATIREGGSRDIINKAATLDNLINYLKTQYSLIDVVSPDDIDFTAITKLV